MKKKALVILLIAILISVFFCIPVNAQILYAGVARDIDQQGNIIMTTSVNQFDENNTSYHQAYLLVTVQLENISSSPTYVGYARFSLSFPDVDCHWDDFESYSNDAVLTRSVDGQYSSFKVIPNNEFSYNDGIVVPPNSSIYAIGIIGLRNSYDNAPVIQGFTVTNSIGTVATSDNYPYGQAVDYSPLISSLNTYFGTEHTDLNNILTLLGYLKVDTGNIYSSVDQLETLISNVADVISYTGSGYGTSYQNVYSRSDTVSNAADDLSVFVQGIYYPVRYEDVDFELNTSSDTLITYQEYVYKVLLIVRVWNKNSNPYRFNLATVLNGIMPSLNTYHISISDVEIKSDIFNYAYLTSNGAMTLYASHNYNNSSTGLIPSGYHYSFFTFYAYTPSEITPNMISPYNISGVIPDWISTTNTYEPTNIFQALKDFIVEWRGNSTTNNNISSDSGTLKTESDAVHQQEQAYYTQNQQAIEATGLRNYNFSQSQGDGIARVSLDFTNLWNSLGTFNSVYIFSLTLGLALTILRHAPNAISRIRWKKNQ